MPDAIEFTEPRLLLVEGSDEVGFFRGFLNFLKITGVQIVNYGGKDSLRQNLRAYVREPTFAQVGSIGIVRDADESAHSARQSVLGSLNNANLPDPPGDAGVKIALFVMPDDSSPGALEDLCLAALVDNPAIDCVDAFLQCMEEAGYSPPIYLSKAKVRAFLVSLEDSEARLGIRAQRSNEIPWDWNHPAFTDLARFLRSL